MADQTTVTDGYKAEVQALSAIMPELAELRRKAITTFTDLGGLPAKRAEAWRYADLSALRTGLLKTHAQTQLEAPLPPKMVANAIRLVFVNGHYSETQSDAFDTHGALRISRLANHVQGNAARSNEFIVGADGVTLLNTALMQDGIVITVPSGQKPEQAIEVVHATTASDRQSAHNRVIIEMGEDTELTVIEQSVGDESAYWYNTLTQARIPQNAKLTHIRVQQDGAAATTSATTHVQLGAHGVYEGTLAALGGKAARAETHVKVLGEGAHAAINGMALSADGQNHDTLTVVDHMVPGATSDQIFRTVGDGKAVSSFQGKIIVAKDAQETAADQSFKALILDRKATANAKPELEILADDVQCSHGATVGELDANALFYLTARGVSPAEARAMLIEAFVGSVIAPLNAEAVRDSFTDMVSGWMTGRATGA